MEYSAAQAAKEVGVSTATITRAIDKHKLSAVKDDNGAWRIDASELFRVFARKPPQNPSMQNDEKPRNGEALRADVEILTEKLRMFEAERDRERRQLEDQVADLRARLDDAAAKADRDAEERRKLTAILIDQRPASPANENPAPTPALETPPAAAPEPRRGGFWSRLLGS